MSDQKKGWFSRIFSTREPIVAPKAPAPKPIAKRGYDVAAGRTSAGHQGIGMFAGAASADREIFAAGRTLREISRDLVRNNPHASKAVDSLTRNIIGDGVQPRPMLADKDANARVMAAWKRWAEYAGCDFDGMSNFHGLQILAMREIIEGGEVLFRRRLISTDPKDQPIPLQLQLLEADYLDPYRDGIYSPDTICIQGVQLTSTGEQQGRRTAYWLYPQHPGALFYNANQPLVSVPIPATEVLHIYEKQRSQVRGVPWGTPAFMTLRNLADYEHAEIVRKKLESCAVAFITTEDNENLAWNRLEHGEDGYDVEPSVLDGRGNPIEGFEPGQIGYLQGGKDVKFNNPAVIGGYGEYKLSQLRSIAAGWRLPYELLSGDMSQVNFSSGRMGLQEFRRFVSSVQHHILKPMFLNPVWKWFCEAAYLAGEIDDPNVPVEWAFPSFDYVNPVEDVQADNQAIRAGLRSWSETIAASGRDPDVVWEEIKAEQARARRDGVVLDSDPGAVSMKGVAQKADTTALPGKPKQKKKGKTGKKQPGNGASADQTPDQG